MQAVLLATGDIQKLRPLTEKIPPPLLTIAGRPVMSYAIELLVRHECRNIMVILHQLPGQIETIFGSGRRWGANLDYTLQRDFMGSAGALKKTERHLNTTFLVMTADMLRDLNLTQAIEQHHAQQNIATRIAVPLTTLTGSSNGTHANGTINTSRPASNNLALSAYAYIFEPEIFQYIPLDRPSDIQKDLIPALQNANLAVNDCYLEGYFNPMSSFQCYQEAQITILNRSYPAKQHHNSEQSNHSTQPLRYLSSPSREVQHGVWIHPSSTVQSSAEIIPPVYIGENCRVGHGVVLGPEVILNNDIVIDKEASIHHSTILSGAYVGQLVHIDYRVVDNNRIIDVKSEEYIDVQDQFLLGESNQRVKHLVQRSFNIILTALSLLLISPLFIAISLILLFTTGQIFVPVQRQKRQSSYGQANQTYNLLHFKTHGKNGQYIWLGRALTLWECYRLPELLNVLVGDIALVGSKPLSVKEASLITEEWQLAQEAGQPGFTGLWYTQAGENSNLDEILITDAYYQATRSWRDDIKIAFNTPMAWAKKKLSRVTK